MPIPANRLRDVPRYIFSTLDERIEAARLAGQEICDLSQSDPNWPPSPFVVEAQRWRRTPTVTRRTMERTRCATPFPTGIGATIRDAAHASTS